jgi:hypothetical protein
MVTLGRTPVHRRARSDALAAGVRAERRGFQIGPRIRVGGTLGKIGQKIKSVLPSPGQAIGSIVAGPLGTVVGGSVDGSTTPLQKNIGNTVAGTAAGIAGAGALGIGPAAGAAGGGGAGGLIKSGIDKVGGLVESGVDKIGGGSGLLDAGLMAAAIASNAADRQRQRELQNQSVDYAKSGYDAKAGLRSRALAQLSTDQPAPDLANIFENPGNGYDRQKRGMPPLSNRTPAAALMTSGKALSGALANRVKATEV